MIVSGSISQTPQLRRVATASQGNSQVEPDAPETLSHFPGHPPTYCTDLTAAGATPREQVRASVQWVYLSSVALFLSGGVFYLYLARVLPYAELGSVVVLTAIAALLSASFGLGLGYGFQHFLSYYLGRSAGSSIRWLLARGWAMALFLFVASSGATATLASPLSTLFFHSTAFVPMIRVLAVYVGFSTAGSILQSELLGLQRFVSFSIVTSVGYMVTFGAPVAFLEIRFGVESIVVGWGVGSAIGCILLVVAILRYRPGEGAVPSAGPNEESVPRLFRSLLVYSMPMFLAALVATGTTYVDRLVLASLTNLANVGVYNYALLIAGGSLFVVGPFGTITLSKFSELFGRDNFEGIRALTRVSITLVALVFVPIGLGIVALAPFVLRVLVGSGYVGASLPLQFLIGIMAIFVPWVVLTNLAAGTRRTPLLLVSTGLALSVNVALCLVLVPRLGMFGAVLGNSSVYWVSFLVLFARLRPSGLFEVDVRSLARIWFASLGMFVVVWLPLLILGYPTTLVPAVVVVGICVLLGLLRVSHAINSETAEALLQVLPKWLNFARPIILWAGRTSTHMTPGGPGST